MKTKHALKIKVVLALLIPFVTYSCGGSSAQDESVESSNYKLEIVDSEGGETVWGITTPNGSSFTVTAPHDATQLEILEYAMKNIPVTPSCGGSLVASSR